MKKAWIFLIFIAAAVALTILTSCSNPASPDGPYYSSNNNNNQQVPGSIPDKPIDGTVVKQLAWIQEFGASGGYYTVRAHLANEIISETQLIRYRNRENITVRIVGQGSGRRLSLGGPIGPMFIVEQPGSHVTLILENITLVGYANNRNCSLIEIDTGTLEMRTDAVITGNTHCSTRFAGINAGGVTVQRGNMIMENALIHGNQGWNGGGVLVTTSSTLTMLGNAVIEDNHSKGSGGGVMVGIDSHLFMYVNARIIDNTAIAYNAADGGGGVFLWRGTLNMHSDNARISGNRVYLCPGGPGGRGGGVFVGTDGSLFISGGTIYGANELSGLANVVNGGNFAAIYRGGGHARAGSYNSSSGFTPDNTNRPSSNNTISVSGNGSSVTW